MNRDDKAAEPKVAEDARKKDMSQQDQDPVRDGGPGHGRPPLPPEAQNLIAKQLRQVYGEMLSEPLPDKFSILLQELSRSEDKS